jgi:hypothetical protein
MKSYSNHTVKNHHLVLRNLDASQPILFVKSSSLWEDLSFEKVVIAYHGNEPTYLLFSERGKTLDCDRRYHGSGFKTLTDSILMRLG